VQSNIQHAVLSLALVITTALAVALPSPAQALEFECVSKRDTRFIRLELPGISNLCEVTVTHANNDRDVKWYANQDTMFCTEKTTELKNKYQDQWGYQCKTWPDHDGVSQLNRRQRIILDAELKFLIEAGKVDLTPFVVEGIKVAASQSSEYAQTTMAVQFFLHEPGTGATRDVTHVIRDDGVSWNTTSKIDSLANYIDANDEYKINSALLSSVTDNGAMEVITVIDLLESSNTQSGCYGNQTLAPQDGELVPRSPHRYICADADNNGGAG